RDTRKSHRGVTRGTLSTHWTSLPGPCDSVGCPASFHADADCCWTVTPQTEADPFATRRQGRSGLACTVEWIRSGPGRSEVNRITSSQTRQIEPTRQRSL